MRANVFQLYDGNFRCLIAVYNVYVVFFFHYSVVLLYCFYLQRLVKYKEEVNYYTLYVVIVAAAITAFGAVVVQPQADQTGQ